MQWALAATGDLEPSWKDFPERDKLLGETIAESLTGIQALTAQAGFTMLMKVKQWRMRN